MLDFRYHALSLVAVFLALAIGIVLGVTIGDSLVSDAERSLRGNLRNDVENAHRDAAQAHDSVNARDRMLDQLYPQLVATRLDATRIAVVSWGPLPGNVESGVRDAVSQAGGRLDSVSVINTPLSDLKSAIGPDEWSASTIDDTSLKDLGASLARSIAGGGHLARTLRSQFPDNYQGRFRRADAVVFYEAPQPDSSSESQAAKERDDDRARTIEGAMIDEMRKQLIAVVGVEAAGADPSQIPRYKSLQISSSDSVDKSGGKIALVFALAGAKVGAFGFKSTADSPLPNVTLTP